MSALATRPPLVYPNLRLTIALSGAIASVAALWLLPWPTSALVLLFASLMAVGWFHPGVLLGFLALSIPVQAVGEVRAGPVAVTLTKLVLAALVTGFALRLASRQSSVRFTVPVWGYAAVVATLLASILQAQALGSWAGEVYRWGIAAVVLVIGQDLHRDRRAILWTLAGVGAGVLFAGALGFYQSLTGVGPASFQSGGVIRAYATFGEPNPFAAYLELSVPLFIALALGAVTRTGEKRDRALIAMCGVVSLVGMGALLLSQSRGGFLGFAAAVIVIVCGSGRRFRQISLVVGLVAVITIGVTPPGHRIAERFVQGGFAVERNVQVTPSTWANQERIAHWRAGIAMMEAYPWTGVGAGQFNARFREFTQVWRFRIPRGHAHNGYIQMGAQAGIPGLFASLFFVFTLLVATWRGFRTAHETYGRSIALGGFAIIVAFCLHSVFDYLSVLSLGVQLSLVVSLASHVRPHPHPGLTE